MNEERTGKCLLPYDHGHDVPYEFNIYFNCVEKIKNIKRKRQNHDKQKKRHREKHLLKSGSLLNHGKEKKDMGKYIY